MDIPKIDKSNGRVINIYKYILYKIISPVLGNTTTFSHDLEKLGRKMINNFIGVCSSDEMPYIDNDEFCFISNLDNSHQSGSHWVAVYVKNKNMYCYDSFGRDINNIMHSYIISYSKKHKLNIVNSDMSDREQNIKENNCGQRSLSFLVVCFHFSIKDALTI